MTNSELSAIRARCEAATPGPWDIDKGWGFIHSPSVMVGPINNHDNDSWDDKDAAFIAHARTDIHALLAHIDEQRVTLAKAEADKAELVDALELLMKAYEMILPGVAKISIPDYALMNDAPCQASAILASVKAQP